MNTNTLYRAALGFVIVICATLAGAGAAAAYVGPPAADVYVRPAITAVAHPEPTPWQRVRGYCHRTHVCVRPSRTLRHQLGIRCGARAWERPENDAAGHLSTFVWVRGPGGAVRTYVS